MSWFYLFFLARWEPDCVMILSLLPFRLARRASSALRELSPIRPSPSPITSPVNSDPVDAHTHTCT